MQKTTAQVIPLHSNILWLWHLLCISVGHSARNQPQAKGLSSYRISHCWAVETHLTTCLTCRPTGTMHCFLLQVFITHSEINAFNFTVAALGSSGVFQMGTCTTRWTIVEQVHDCHTVRQELFLPRQLKRLLHYHLHPSFIPQFTSLCCALQNSLAWVGNQGVLENVWTSMA